MRPASGRRYALEHRLDPWEKEDLESDIEPKWISSHQAFFRERCTMTKNSRYVVGPRICSMQIPERSAIGRYQAGCETMQTLYQHHKSF